MRGAEICDTGKKFRQSATYFWESKKTGGEIFITCEGEYKMANGDRKVWLITGCSTGFGRELAKQLLEKGERVVVTARDAGKVRDLVDINKENALAVALDPQGDSVGVAWQRKSERQSSKPKRISD